MITVIHANGESFCEQKQLEIGQSVLYGEHPGIIGEIKKGGSTAVVGFKAENSPADGLTPVDPPNPSIRTYEIEVGNLSPDPNHKYLGGAPFMQFMQWIAFQKILPRPPISRETPVLNEWRLFQPRERVFIQGEDFYVSTDNFRTSPMKHQIELSGSSALSDSFNVIRHSVSRVIPDQKSVQTELENLGIGDNMPISAELNNLLPSEANLRFVGYDAESGEILLSADSLTAVNEATKETGEIVNLGFGTHAQKKWEVTTVNEFGLNASYLRERSIYRISWEHFRSLKPQPRMRSIQRNIPDFSSGFEDFRVEFTEIVDFESDIVQAPNTRNTPPRRTNLDSPTPIPKIPFAVHRIYLPGKTGESIEVWIPERMRNSEMGDKMIADAQALISATPPELQLVNTRIILSPFSDDVNFAGYSFPAREECCSRDILLDWKENRGFEKILNAYIHETGHSLARLLSEKSGGEAPVGFIEAILRNPQAPSGYSIRGDLTSLRNRNEIQFEERFAEAFSIYIATRYGQSGRGFDNYVEILEPHFAFFDQVIRELQQNPLERTPITYFRERF